MAEAAQLMMFCCHFTKVLSHVEDSKGHWWHQTDITLSFDNECGLQINYYSPKRLDTLSHKMLNREQFWKGIHDSCADVR